ncbi:MAG: cytochrome C oxidase subunit IV family protein [Pirellulaceae bacterium]
MAAHAHVHEDHDEHHAPPGSGKYWAVFITLVVLTIISFAVGNSSALRENAPQVMWAAMMAVSSAKAMLVILFFMHLKWEANWKYVLTVPASIMSVFLLLMLIPDIGLRTRNYADDRWLYAAEPARPHVEEHHEGALHDAAHPRAEEGDEGRAFENADGPRQGKEHATEGASKHGL